MRWAIEKHHSVNHMYDKNPYDVHLWSVFYTANIFIHYIPEEKKDVVIAACWLHDTIEDCRVTYNDIKQEFGEEIAEIVYALTNEKGRTRKDRANSRYYEGIRNCPFAGFVKICDRIANFKYSIENGSSMVLKYQQEADVFHAALYDTGTYLAMWEYMRSLIYTTS